MLSRQVQSGVGLEGDVALIHRFVQLGSPGQEVLDRWLCFSDRSDARFRLHQHRSCIRSNFLNSWAVWNLHIISGQVGTSRSVLCCINKLYYCLAVAWLFVIRHLRS